MSLTRPVAPLTVKIDPAYKDRAYSVYDAFGPYDGPYLTEADAWAVAARYWPDMLPSRKSV